MTRIKNNRDIFARQGNPWEHDLPEKTPRLSPDGKLHLPLSARSHLLRNPVPASDKDEASKDLSFSTEHCLPIHIRLAKERNTLLRPFSAPKAPKAPTSTGKGKGLSISQRAAIARHRKKNSLIVRV